MTDTHKEDLIEKSLNPLVIKRVQMYRYGLYPSKEEMYQDIVLTLLIANERLLKQSIQALATSTEVTIVKSN